MAGRGPAPKTVRRNRSDVPARGDWQATPGIGWQHGKAIPAAPDGLKPETATAWKTWFGSWFAAHWTPEDLPGLRLIALTYDQVVRGEYQRGPELRMLMDTYGITPKGQQDRRWAQPKPEDNPAAADIDDGPYAHLRAV